MNDFLFVWQCFAPETKTLEIETTIARPRELPESAVQADAQQNLFLGVKHTSKEMTSEAQDKCVIWDALLPMEGVPNTLGRIFDPKVSPWNPCCRTTFGLMHWSFFVSDFMFVGNVSVLILGVSVLLVYAPNGGCLCTLGYGMDAFGRQEEEKEEEKREEKESGQPKENRSYGKTEQKNKGERGEMLSQAKRKGPEA